MLEAEHNESWQQLRTRLGAKLDAKRNVLGAEPIARKAEQTECAIKLHEAEYWHRSDGGYNNGVDHRLHGEMSLKAK
eukprot:840720-Alexandrium_andersonii.AAC.1